MYRRSQPMLIHFVGVLTLMMSIIFGAIAYLYHRDYADQSVELAKAHDEIDQYKNALVKTNKDIDTLRELLGYDYEKIGSLDDPSPSTIAGGLNADFRRAETEVPKDTVHSLLMRLTSNQDDLEEIRDDLTTDLEKSREEYAALSKRWQALNDLEKQARNRAEDQLQKQIAQQTEAVKDLNKQIEDSEALRREQMEELGDLQARLDKLRKDIAAKENRHKLTVRRLNGIIEKTNSDIFETPDAHIVAVDQTTRKVWIDVGSKDYLRAGVTFNVYPKNDELSKRSKATIKIIRILNADMAEAKIVKDDNSQPIVRGDAVYTPLWTAGRKERFAFVGFVDVDNDGRSDFAQVKRFVEGAGAEIHSYIDENGNRVGEKIDLSVKFLIVGAIPDPATAKASKRRKVYEKMVDHIAQMRTESREFGIRTVSMNDFLSYIGFKSLARTRLPGSTKRIPGRKAATTDR